MEMFCLSILTTSSHTVFKYTVERSETLRMILAVGIEKRKHALDGLSCTSWINWKIFSDYTGSPGLDSIFLHVSPIKRKWWWKICCETLLDVVTAITPPATVTVKNVWLSLNPRKKFDVSKKDFVKIFIWNFSKPNTLLSYTLEIIFH